MWMLGICLFGFWVYFVCYMRRTRLILDELILVLKCLEETAGALCINPRDKETVNKYWRILSRGWKLVDDLKKRM